MSFAKQQTKYIADWTQSAETTAEAALNASPEHQLLLQNTSKRIYDLVENLKRKQDEKEPAVRILPVTATNQELSKARAKQAVRRGDDVYLPAWSSSKQVLPDILLRTAFFSSSSSIQKQNDLVLAGDRSNLVSEEEIASLSNIRLLFSGYRLCQYDRQVYATCLEHYREQPLEPAHSTRDISTTFHAFASKMGSTHNTKTYLAIRASLLRLSFAQLRVRQNGLDINVPQLLSVSFDDKATTSDMHDSHLLRFRVPEVIGELFGVACWTAVDKVAVDFDGLRGWVANFYATHNKAKGLPVETLYRLSGYESKMSNFRDSLTKALDKLKEANTPLCSRIARYHFTKDRNKPSLLVVREEWQATQSSE